LPYDEYYSGIILETTPASVVLQRRDNIPSIANPGMLSTFGGRRKSREDASSCALREIAEETSLAFVKNDLSFFTELSCPIENDRWMHCSFFRAKIDDVSKLDLKEGQCVEIWAPCEVLNQPDLTPVARTVLRKLCKSYDRS
jgi:ADP-ribose pyrophosphatase YjhB (NUDIX family)